MLINQKVVLYGVTCCAHVTLCNGVKWHIFMVTNQFVTDKTLGSYQ
jgi:hypothetical protein